MDGKANKRLGQHFLVSRIHAERIVDFADIKPEDYVLEIGAGKGALTDVLVRSGCRLTAVEVDPRWVLELRTRYQGYENLKLIEEDILRLDLAATLDFESKGARWKVVANLPYNLATAILQRLAEWTHCLESVTVMVQREVAERILAKAHHREIGLITHLLGYHFSCQPGFQVPPGAFRPPPKVVSMVIRLIPLNQSSNRSEERAFRRLLEAAFSHRRKQLAKNLTGLGLTEELSRRLLLQRGIRPDARAENLEKEDFIWLARNGLGSRDSEFRIQNKDAGNEI